MKKILAGAAVIALAVPVVLASVPARASAPVPFPVHDSGSFLVTGHPVFPGERLVIRGRAVQVDTVEHHGPAFIAHPLGVLPASWKGKTLAAVIEG